MPNTTSSRLTLSGWSGSGVAPMTLLFKVACMDPLQPSLFTDQMYMATDQHCHKADVHDGQQADNDT